MVEPKTIPGTGGRKPARSFTQLGELAGHVRWMLGERSRWIIALPILSVVGAASEVVLLVSIVRSLLLLVDADTTADVGLGPMSAELSAQALLILAVVASLISIAMRSAESIIVGRLAARCAYTARNRLIDTFFAADWRAMSRLRAGRLQQLLGQNVQIASNAVPLLATMLAALINLLVYGGVVAVNSPAVAAVFAVTGLILVSAFSWLRTRSKAEAKTSQGHVRDVQLAATSLSNLNRELQLFDVQAAARAELNSLNEAARRSLGRLRTMQRFLPNLFQQTVLLTVVGLVFLAREANLDASSFGTAAILAVRSVSFLQQLNNANQSFVEMAPYLEEIHTSIDSHVEQRRLRGTESLDVVERLEANDMSFTYESDQPSVLCDVSIRISAGEWVGIVGPSGGGKTTLANLLAGLLTPTAGSYFVNDKPATNYSAASWASRSLRSFPKSLR